MDQNNNSFNDASVTDQEKYFMDSLLDGVFPEWFQAELDPLDTNHSTVSEEEAEGTPDPQAPEAGSPPSDVQDVENRRASFASSTTPNTMPPQAVGASANPTEAHHEDESRSVTPKATLPTANTHNGAKRRLSDTEDLVDAKRVRPDENRDPHVQAGQALFGPHFLGPCASNYYPPPPMPFAHPGPYTALGAGIIPPAPAGQPIMGAYPYGYQHLIYPGHPLLPFGNGVPGMPLPIPYYYTQAQTSRRQGGAAPGAAGTNALKAPAPPRFEDSDDAARQRTIAAHRANDARTNKTDNMICLWKDANASEPCHQPFSGTEALLQHCVASHGVSGSKAKKGKTSCAWADCPTFEINIGLLKRHLGEVHGRCGRKRGARTQGGSVAT